VTDAPVRAPRATDLVLAGVHLRLGSLGLARAELEAMAGQDALDEEALLDLAEARWRTGDLPGAGDAAQAYLASGGESAVGYVIAAEAVAAIGRPTEARTLAAEALERADAGLDAIFAGMPRSLIWPADSSDVGVPAGTLFDGLGRASRSLDRQPEPTPPASAIPPPVVPPPVVPSAEPEPRAGDPGLWDRSNVERAARPEPPTAERELAAGREALTAGDVESAVLHLGVALRLAPALAPAILDAASGTPAERTSAALELLRGDAYRLVGHETAAQQAYASASALSTSSDRAPAEHPTGNDPTVTGLPDQEAP
jgi:tetratricopeptide (TPR) repeat protein